MRVLFVVGLSLFAALVVRAQNAGNGFAQPIATTVQLPTFGVSFDADGVLKLTMHTDPTGQLIATRLEAARAALHGNLARTTTLRKVSIVRLQAAMSNSIRDGKGLSDVMQNLAGLTRITSIFCYPDSEEVVLAGPAEPWVKNVRGMTVGIHSGRPTLQLADLVVALRAYQPNINSSGFVGCTINPNANGLQRLHEFQKTIPKVVSRNDRAQVARWVANGVHESLGMSRVQVFGISSRTHFARVMIKADYRMKRMAVGVEEPPVRMASFAAALTTAPGGGIQRWWFTPAYDGVRESPDHLAMQIDGQGVQLQTESKDVAPGGAIADTGRKPSRAARAFATSFTKRYDDIADSCPIYAQLRQMTDFLIVAAYFRKHDWYRKANWDANELIDETLYPVNTLNNPLDAPVAVNAFWKLNRLFVPAGGGVSIVAEKALQETIEDADLANTRSINQPQNQNHWWWD